MDKEAVSKPFDEKTKELGIEDVLLFDKTRNLVRRNINNINRVGNLENFIPAEYTKEEFREGISKVEGKLRQDSNSLNTQEKVDKFNPLRHYFADGCYIREISTPAGQLLITKIHKISHPFFLLVGKLSILSEKGEQVIEAPYYGITLAGTKRIVYVHEDCIFVTVHVTDKTDIDEIEEDIIAKSFDEIDENNKIEKPTPQGGEKCLT